MKPFPTYAAPGYQFDARPGLEPFGDAGAIQGRRVCPRSLDTRELGSGNGLAAVTPSVHT
jgi:hypothetical protein